VRPAERKPDNRWSEGTAENELKAEFGADYVDFILCVDKAAYNGYIDKVKKYVQKNSMHITTAQLRNIFSRIRGITDYQEIPLLRPKLAYISGRAEKSAMKTMLYLLDRLIVGIDSSAKLRQFQDFFEAVVAYHKYCEKINLGGGKN